MKVVVGVCAFLLIGGLFGCSRSSAPAVEVVLMKQPCVYDYQFKHIGVYRIYTWVVGESLVHPPEKVNVFRIGPDGVKSEIVTRLVKQAVTQHNTNECQMLLFNVTKVGDYQIICSDERENLPDVMMSYDSPLVTD